MKLDQAAFIRMGIAAMLPGMRHMLELMEGFVSEYREMLDQLQAGNANGLLPAKRARPPATLALPAAPAFPEPKRGPGPRKGQKNAKLAAYWAAMSPEERTAVVRRRMKKAKKATATVRIVKTPERVGANFTVFGAARELGVSTYKVRRLFEETVGKARMVNHPEYRGSRLAIITPAQLERLRKAGAAPGHPRDSTHPGHAAYIENLKNAARRRMDALGEAIRRGGNGKEATA